MAHCHCSMCRKHTGALYDASIGLPAEGFRWLTPPATLVRRKASTEANFARGFCSRCGSVAPTVDDDGGMFYVPAGQLEDDPGLRPQMHIFVGSKSPSCTITDALPQHEHYPPGVNLPVAQRESPASAAGVVQGSCLCGRVAFELSKSPRRMVNCHCSRCRRSRGSAYATNVFVNLEDLHWTRGAEQARVYRVPDARAFATSFCVDCGGLLPCAFEKIGKYLVPVGALDTPLALTPGAHIHVASKAPWFEFSDDLPRYEASPPRERLLEVMFGD
ncbi:MAG TPA: GFA family protein [Steroidobacter sp.]|nr:GFA family protein [Steroidobacteraceae bacterium]HLS80428.1 GFA family protein [Steroidobacter sp.]